MQCALKIAKFVTEQIPLFIYITVGGKIFSRKIGRLDHNIHLHTFIYLPGKEHTNFEEFKVWVNNK